MSLRATQLFILTVIVPITLDQGLAQGEPAQRRIVLPRNQPARTAQPPGVAGKPAVSGRDGLERKCQRYLDRFVTEYKAKLKRERRRSALKLRISKKAHLRNVGIGLTAAGTALLVVGGVFYALSTTEPSAAMMHGFFIDYAFMGLGGLFDLIGIPMLVTGAVQTARLRGELRRLALDPQDRRPRGSSHISSFDASGRPSGAIVSSPILRF